MPGKPIVLLDCSLSLSLSLCLVKQNCKLYQKKVDRFLIITSVRLIAKRAHLKLCSLFAQPAQLKPVLVVGV